MNMRLVLAMAIVTMLALYMAGETLAQDDSSEDCSSCRTNNFYYVLAAAIIIFLIFFWWTNRHRVPKRPETVEKSDEKKL